MSTLKHHVTAALVALPPVRVCAYCSNVVGELTDAQIEAIRLRSERLVRKGWEQYIDLLVECENALVMISQDSLRKAARQRVAKLVGEAYARKWGAK